MGFLLEKIVEGRRCLAKLVCLWLNVSVFLRAGVSRKALQGAWRDMGYQGNKLGLEPFLRSIRLLKTLDVWSWVTKPHGCSIPWTATFGVVPTSSPELGWCLLPRPWGLEPW